MAPQETQSSPDERLYAISTQLSALNERSSEANRRLGVIEKQLDARVAEAARLIVLEGKVEELEEALSESKKRNWDWWTWGLQFLTSTVGAAVILWGLHKLGLGGP